MPSLVRPLSVGQFGVAQRTGVWCRENVEGVKTCLDAQARKHVVDWAHLERGSSTEGHCGGIFESSWSGKRRNRGLEFDQ